jgi:isoleucyl-tRNA synthetase
LIDPARITREAQIREAMPVLTSAHAAILAAMELARQDKVLGSSLGCVVVIEVPPGSKAAEILDPLTSELPSIFIASEVEVVNSGVVPSRVETEWAYSQVFEVYGSACKPWVLPPRKHKCLRCWRHVAEKENDLCGRCFGVVTEIGL